MTLKELIAQVSFDELLPALKTMTRGNENSLYAFREAYDRLRLMEPASDIEGEVHVGWHGGMVGEDKWIGVSGLSGDYWCKNLSKEIIVEEGIQLTSNELAAHCLWEITFYGFSEDEIGNTFERMTGEEKAKNKYDIALKKLNASIWKRQTPRKYRCVFQGKLYFQGDILTYRRRCRNKKNRSKRMREHRQERRKKYLETMSMRENLVQSLSAPGSSFARQDVAYLLEVEYGKQYDYTAVVSGTEGRLSYILDSMTKYQQEDLSQYDNAIVCIVTSSRYSLLESEIADFKAAVRAHLKYDDIRFGMIQTDEDQTEVKVKLLLNKMEK